MGRGKRKNRAPQTPRPAGEPVSATVARAQPESPAPPAPAHQAAAPQRTLDQDRARHAWKTVQDARQLAERQRDDFAGHAKKLPMRIRAAGLGQALAFVAAKSRARRDGDGAAEGSRKLLLALDQWLLDERKLAPVMAESASRTLEAIVEGDAALLRRATAEAMAWLGWLNRFAEAEGLRGGEDVE
ncbi:MAG: type III-B CRISPR module-associated protein Cmr5 [Pseudomonadota bacterium]|nr:type III-B CRISPR module-associated protein Cmr5 [Pseudomonadota bacterium]